MSIINTIGKFISNLSGVNRTKLLSETLDVLQKADEILNCPGIEKHVLLTIEDADGNIGIDLQKLKTNVKAMQVRVGKQLEIEKSK